MKEYPRLFLVLLLAVSGCHRTPTAQPPKPKPVEFIVDGKSRLIYDCNKFKSQIKTLDDIITLRLRAIETLRELLKDEHRNLALITLD